MSLLTVNVDYCGKPINEIIQKAFAQTKFYTTYGARRIQAMKSKYFLWDISNSFEFATYECCPTVLPGNVTLNQRDRDLCEFMMTGVICHKDLIGTAREWQYRQGMDTESIFDDSLFISAMTENILNTASFQLDDIILNGNTAGATGTYLDLCDGLLTKFNADATVVDVTAVPGNLTIAGIVGELNKLIAAVDPTLLYNSRFPLQFAVSTQIAIVYQQFLAANAFMNPNSVNIALNYMGIPIIPIERMPATEMFLTYANNIVLVTDDQSDFSRLIMKDMSLVDICDEVRIKLQGRSGVDYSFGEYVVYYH